MFEAVNEMFNAVLSQPIFRIAFYLFLFVVPFLILSNLLSVFLCDPSFSLSDLFVPIGSFIKNKLIDLAVKVLGFDKVYKLGWARKGVDYFDCGEDCHVCPKYAECELSVRAEKPADDV